MTLPHLHFSKFSFFRVFCLIVFLLVALFFIPFSEVFAQGAGVSIKPAQFEEALDPGVEKQYSLMVENLSPGEQTFYLFVRNISGIQDDGRPIFAKTNTEVTGYEIADWISIATTTITLAGGASTQVDFSMFVPQNASPGSHFGGVFVSIEPPEVDGIGAAIGYQVASILSIRISGEINESASIRQFSTDSFLYGSQSIEFLVRVENQGNVLVRPTGPLEIFNMLGKKVGALTFNEERRSVFPFDTRDFANLRWEGDSPGFGRYEARLSASYGEEGAKKSMSSTVTFWILPLNIVMWVGGTLAVLFIIITVSVRLYIRRSLAHLSGGRRMVGRRQQRATSTVLLLLVVMLTVTALLLLGVLLLLS